MNAAVKILSQQGYIPSTCTPPGHSLVIQWDINPQEKTMATRQTEIPVVCYELPPVDLANIAGLRGTLMKPSPLEVFTGRYGRVEDKNRARDQLVEAGHSLHVINWGEHPETKEPCLVAYIWAKGAEPPKPPAKPEIPQPRVRRTATSRRHAPPPESRKKP